MIDSINQVKTNRKLSSQILCLLSLPSLPCLKLMLNLDFLPHTSFGVLWTSLPDSHWPKSALYCSIRRQHPSVGIHPVPLLRKPMPGLFT